jgi:hypothetical protein
MVDTLTLRVYKQHMPGGGSPGRPKEPHMVAVFVFSPASGTFVSLATFADVAEAVVFIAEAEAADEVATGEVREYRII